MRVDPTGARMLEPRDRATYPIQRGWNVVVELVYADDQGVVQLNGTTVATIDFGQGSVKVALQNILKDGDNKLRILGINHHAPVWSLHYRIGVFDDRGQPQYDAIDITVKGETPHSGPQLDVIYDFPRT